MRHFERHFGGAFGGELNGILALLDFFRIALWKFESGHHRVIGSGIAINRGGELGGDSAQCFEVIGEFVHVKNLRFFLASEAGDHLT